MVVAASVLAGGIFGVSYPTIKSVLNRIAEHLDFVGTAHLLQGLSGTRIEVEEGQTALLISVR
jgi:hypothetical protein